MINQQNANPNTPEEMTVPQVLQQMVMKMIMSYSQQDITIMIKLLNKAGLDGISKMLIFSISGVEQSTQQFNQQSSQDTNQPYGQRMQFGGVSSLMPKKGVRK